MTAFERVKSGIPSLDEAFHNIRLGDNVVWSVSDLADFRVFMEPFVRQAIADGRNIIYGAPPHRKGRARCILRVRLPERAADGVGDGPHDGEFLQADVPVPL